MATLQQRLWRFVGDTDWMYPGVFAVPSGTYSIEFKQISGYSTPASQTLTVTNGALRVTATYTATSTGTLTVTLSGASGQWSADGGTTWNASGASLTLTAGTYTITFSAVTGYTTPSSQTATVTAGLTTTATAAYTATSTGTLTVTLTGASGQWSADGGSSWNESGDTLTVVAGSYTVTFSAVSGYTAPSSQSVTVAAGGAQTITAAYTADSSGGGDSDTIASSYVGQLLGTYTNYDGGSSAVFSIMDSTQTGTSRVWYAAAAGEGGDYLIYRNGVWNLVHDTMGVGSVSEIDDGWGMYITVQGTASTIGGTFSNGATFTTYSSSSECLVAGTQITLADGTTKAVEDITYEDELMVWDFDMHRPGKAKPAWIRKPGHTNFYYHNVYSNGATLDTVGRLCRAHRHFCADTEQFEYTPSTVGLYIRTSGGSTRHVASELVMDSEVDFYNVVTEHHYNLYANGILTSCRLSNMKHDKNNASGWWQKYPLDIVQKLRLDEIGQDMTNYIDNMLSKMA